jgi:integrase
MASITKRGKGWLVQVRKRGYPSVARTFSKHAEAKTWAAEQEAAIVHGTLPDRPAVKGAMTLGDILDRYMQEITPTKRGAASELLRIKAFKRDPIAAVALRNFSSSHVAAYRDRRLLAVSSSSVRRELTIIRHALEIARREWRLPIVGNPVADIRRPLDNCARERRLEAGEEARLMEAIDAGLNSELRPAVELAIHTGLRRGELLNLDWNCIDLNRRLARIPVTKTGKPRTIPLTDAACTILLARHPRPVGRVFQMTANALQQAWQRAVKRAGLVDLRYHDLRHEALSRMFELGLSMPEVALISGHREPRMLLRYTHIRPSDVARKLSGKQWNAPSMREHAGHVTLLYPTLSLARFS